MTENEVYAFLTDTFRTVFKREIMVTPTLTAADVNGWDSFAQISLVVATEEHYGIEFSSKELDSLKNVGDFVAVVLRKSASGAV